MIEKKIGTSKPFISICIPTYNGESFIMEALQSIQNQNFRDFEVIISDDNSSDDTLKICEKFKESVDFPVHIFHHLPNGIGANWNNCIENANGEYIKFLFQDDALSEGALQAFVDYTCYEGKHYKAIISKREIIHDQSQYSLNWISSNGDLQLHMTPDQNGNYIINKSFFKSEQFYRYANNRFGEPSASFFHRSLFKTFGPYNEKLKQLLDLEFLHRILKKEDILIVSQKLVKFRLHNQQATYVNLAYSRKEKQNYIRRTIPIQYFRYLPWKKIILSKLH